jgi:hypothetical protein
MSSWLLNRALPVEGLLGNCVVLAVVFAIDDFPETLDGFRNALHSGRNACDLAGPLYASQRGISQTTARESEVDLRKDFYSQVCLR